jgi:hypothetical protein
MKKILIIFVAMTFIAFGYSPGAFAAGMDKPMSSEVGELDAASADIIDWIGKDIKNLQGEDLGEMNGFVREETGEVSLVIVYHDEKSIAVPYSALSFNESEDHLVLDVTKDQLASAPEIGVDENLTDRALAEETYRHFGERPVWSDEGLDTREYFGTEDFGFSGDDALEHIEPDAEIDNF